MSDLEQVPIRQVKCILCFPNNSQRDTSFPACKDPEPQSPHRPAMSNKIPLTYNAKSLYRHEHIIAYQHARSPGSFHRPLRSAIRQILTLAPPYLHSPFTVVLENLRADTLLDCRQRFQCQTHEENIQLAIRPSLAFRKTKVAVHNRDDVSTEPEQATARAPVPVLRAEHAWGKLLAHDTG